MQHTVDDRLHKVMFAAVPEGVVVTADAYTVEGTMLESNFFVSWSDSIPSRQSDQKTVAVAKELMRADYQPERCGIASAQLQDDLAWLCSPLWDRDAESHG